MGVGVGVSVSAGVRTVREGVSHLLGDCDTTDLLGERAEDAEGADRSASCRGSICPKLIHKSPAPGARGTGRTRAADATTRRCEETMREMALRRPPTGMRPLFVCVGEARGASGGVVRGGRCLFVYVQA